MPARPYANGVEQAVATKKALAPHADTFFRGRDQSNADFCLHEEREREFDEYVAAGELPNLSLVRFPHAHFGNFSATPPSACSARSRRCSACSRSASTTG